MQESTKKQSIVKDERSIQGIFLLDSQLVHHSFMRSLTFLEFWNNSNWVGFTNTKNVLLVWYLFDAWNEMDAHHKSRSLQVNMVKVKNQVNRS